MGPSFDFNAHRIANLPADKYKHQQAFHSKKRQPEKITSTATYFQSPTSVSQTPLRSAHSFLNSFLDIGYGYPNAFCDSSCQASSQTAVKGTRQMCQKGQIALYVGEIQRTRFVVSISYLNHPSFLDLLNRAEEEFGFNQPMGGLIIPCNEDVFIDITSRLHAR